jgi:hypothetical protein
MISASRKVAGDNLHSGNLEASISRQMEIVGNVRIDSDDGDKGNCCAARRGGHVRDFDRLGRRKQLRIKAVPNLFSFDPNNEMTADARVDGLVSDSDTLRKREFLCGRGPCCPDRKRRREPDQPQCKHQALRGVRFGPHSPIGHFGELPPRHKRHANISWSGSHINVGRGRVRDWSAKRGREYVRSAPPLERQSISRSGLALRILFGNNQLVSRIGFLNLARSARAHRRRAN